MNKKLLLGSMIASTAMAATIKPILFEPLTLTHYTGTVEASNVGTYQGHSSLTTIPDQDNDGAADILYTFDTPGQAGTYLADQQTFATAIVNLNNFGYTGSTLVSGINIGATTNSYSGVNFSKFGTNNPTFTRGTNPYFSSKTIPLEEITFANNATTITTSQLKSIYIDGLGYKGLPLQNAAAAGNGHRILTSCCPPVAPGTPNDLTCNDVTLSFNHTLGTAKITVKILGSLYFMPKSATTSGILYPVDMNAFSAYLADKFSNKFATNALNLTQLRNIGDVDGNGTDDFYTGFGYILLMNLQFSNNRWTYSPKALKQILLNGIAFDHLKVQPSFLGNLDHSIDGSTELSYPSNIPILDDKNIRKSSGLYFYSIDQTTLNDPTSTVVNLQFRESIQQSGTFVNGHSDHFGITSTAWNDGVVVASSINNGKKSLWYVQPDFVLNHDIDILNFENISSGWIGTGISQTTTNYANLIDPTKPGALSWSTTGGSWQEITSKTIKNALIPPTWTNATLHARIATSTTASRDYNGNIQVKLIEANGATTWLGQFELINIPGQSYKDYAFKIPYEYINLLFRAGSKISLTLSSGSFNTKSLILDQLRFTNDPTDNGLDGGTPQNCATLPQWTKGHLTLQAQRAIGTDGLSHSYTCIAGPTVGWCSSEAYSPQSVYWPQAWKHNGICQ